jgi:hypothetical protein
VLANYNYISTLVQRPTFYQHKTNQINIHTHSCEGGGKECEGEWMCVSVGWGMSVSEGVREVEGRMEGVGQVGRKEVEGKQWYRK